MRVAVTGGAGYIGSSLVRRLLDESAEVVSVDNLMNGDYGYLKELRSPSLRLVMGDIRDRGLLDEAIKGSDSVVHLAALSTLDLCNMQPDEAVSTNIYGTYCVLESAKRSGIGKVIFCSSSAVYGRPLWMPVDEEHPLRPLNLYGVTKLSAEKLMEAYYENEGIETVILRFGNAYGLGLYTHWDAVIPKFVRLGLNGNPLTIYGDGESSRDFVHVEDIVSAIILALKKKGIGGEACNVGGEVLKVGVIAELVSDELKKSIGRNANIVHLPPRLGETDKIGYKLDKIERVLGYRPRFTVRYGVEQLISHYSRTSNR